MIHTSKARILPAEWDPQSAVQLTFPHENTDWADVLGWVLPCFVQIVTTISRFQKVIVVCQNVAATRLVLQDAHQENLILTEGDSNDTWARDHAAITVLEQQEPVLLDFVFNGWGLKFPADKDNLLNRLLHHQGVLNGKMEHGGIVLEGGGIESDGQGTLMTTAECLLSPNRNPHLNEAEIETHLQNVLGVQRILWLRNGYLAGDDTDSHIDTLARFCDAQTIAYVQCPDPDDEHYEALQKMEAELKDFRTAESNPYHLVPLPWPDACFDDEGQRLPATYANFLIINGAVLVPTYQVAQDEAALAIFRELFPGREVIGIDCRPLIWQHGSLHCVTMQYPVGVVGRVD
jgi:agmatine deiminase